MRLSARRLNTVLTASAVSALEHNLRTRAAWPRLIVTLDPPFDSTSFYLQDDIPVD